MDQINLLYTLNLHNIMCQIYFNLKNELNEWMNWSIEESQEKGKGNQGTLANVEQQMSFFFFFLIFYLFTWPCQVLGAAHRIFDLHCIMQDL